MNAFTQPIKPPWIGELKQAELKKRGRQRQATPDELRSDQGVQQMIKRQWHSGPPPSVGWWPASIDENPKTIRWWDGMWSVAAHPDDDSRTAAQLAKLLAPRQQSIKWTERWWE